MWEFAIVHGTQAELAGHRIGVIDSGLDMEGRGGARLGVRCGDDLDRFSFFARDEHLLPDGWTIRLVGVRMPADEFHVPVVDLELISPDKDL